MVLLRLLSLRLRGPPPPPLPILEPPSVPRKVGPKFQVKRLVLALSPIGAPEVRAGASWFWKRSCAESEEAPRLPHPRPAYTPGLSCPAQSLPTTPRVRHRPPEKDRRVTPGSRTGGKKKRRARRAPGRPAPSPPPIHKPLRGRAPSPRDLQSRALFSLWTRSDWVEVGRGGRGKRGRRCLKRSGRIPEGRGGGPREKS